MLKFLFKKCSMHPEADLDSELYWILLSVNLSEQPFTSQDSLIDTVIFLLPSRLKQGDTKLLREIIKQKATLFVTLKKYIESSNEAEKPAEPAKKGRKKNV